MGDHRKETHQNRLEQQTRRVNWAILVTWTTSLILATYLAAWDRYTFRYGVAACLGLVWAATVLWYLIDRTIEKQLENAEPDQKDD